MNQKKLILVATAFMFLSFIAASPAQAIVDPVSIAVIGFVSLLSLIAVDKTIESVDNDSMTKQEQQENKLQTAVNDMK